MNGIVALDASEGLGRDDGRALLAVNARAAASDRPEDLNDRGVTLSRLGEHSRAEAMFREALKLRPGYALARENMACSLRESGRLEEAEINHREAIEADPGRAEGRVELGVTLSRRGKFLEAVAAFDEALRLRPAYPEALNNQGIALAKWGKSEAAEAAYRQALRLRGDYPEARNNLGNVLHRLGRREEALESFREATRLRPDYGQAHHNLANCLWRLGKATEAEAAFIEAIRLRPRDPDIINDQAIALAEAGRFEQAIEAYRRALALRPEYAEVQNNLGNALRQIGRLEESVACYREALRVKPRYAEAHNNLGISLRTMGRLDEAAACYTRALELRPDYVDAHVNRSMAWLRAGRFELGWPEYEWRWKKAEAKRPDFIQPAWNGAPLAGRTVLLYTEQGSGDTLQFIRYASLVRRRGGRVVVACPGSMIPILSRCRDIDRLVPSGGPLPEFDLHAGLMSLPGIFHTDLDSIPSGEPYLFADEDLVGDWRRRLVAVPGFRVGVVWQGNPKYPSDRARSFPLAALRPVAEVPGVSLVSLQVENGLEQLEKVDFRILNPGAELTRAPGMFMDAAAAIRNLDLVIACDTAVAHLAGGIGMPTWLALPYSPDWRWLVNRVDSPWYPTARLFRQGSHGDWGGVFARMAGELGERLAARNRPDSGA